LQKKVGRGGLLFGRLDPAVFRPTLLGVVRRNRREGPVAEGLQARSRDAVLADQSLHDGLGTRLRELERPRLRDEREYPTARTWASTMGGIRNESIGSGYWLIG